MDARELFALLDQLETQLPLREGALAALFGVTFSTTRDPHRGEVRIAATSGLRIELHPSDLTLVLPGVEVAWPAFGEKYPGGHALPPPPPGYGGESLSAYVVNRAWGQFWFTLDGNRIVRVALAPGSYGYPGV
jgi:hypothetical protein